MRWAHPIGRVRLLGLMEAISFIVLLAIAMPLKYAADMPMAVRVVGMAHGLLFIALGLAVGAARGRAGWSMAQSAKIVIAALFPFGPFFVDGWLRREQERLDQGIARSDPGQRPPRA